MNRISRPMFVGLVLVGGILLILVAKAPHSVCDSQIEVFKESQKGSLYPTENKGQKRAPLYGRYLENCRLGNSPGACYELFSLMKKLMRDLEAAPIQCLPEMAEVEPLKKIFNEQVELMALLSWGNHPPEKGAQRFNWLETSDLALFCSVKKIFKQIFGPEGYEERREKTYSKLPGEAIVLREGVCANCESRKGALEVLSTDEIWARSLFSVRCEEF